MSLMLRSLMVPCPACCDGFVTTQDRHARTVKDVCRHCDGTGWVVPRTGETPEASYQAHASDGGGGRVAGAGERP